ncbi:hypothetical protein GCM10010401_14950 [Rarobacter faecitabidus]
MRTWIETLVYTLVGCALAAHWVYLFVGASAPNGEQSQDAARFVLRGFITVAYIALVWRWQRRRERERRHVWEQQQATLAPTPEEDIHGEAPRALHDSRNWDTQPQHRPSWDRR